MGWLKNVFVFWISVIFHFASTITPEGVPFWEWAIKKSAHYKDVLFLRRHSPRGEEGWLAGFSVCHTMLQWRNTKAGDPAYLGDARARTKKGLAQFGPILKCLPGTYGGTLYARLVLTAATTNYGIYGPTLNCWKTFQTRRRRISELGKYGLKH